ncbi:MAG: sulfotransferase, partial [Symploca sp. SIO2E6]|nr:sulfotransferase [Symploca sp. SIO2E6]
QKWHKVAQLFEQYHNHPQFLTIYYEQLVTNPEAQMRQICHWLGREFSDSMLNFYHKNAQEGLVPTHRLKWHEKTLQPVSQERLNAWQTELSIPELEALELLNRQHLVQLGYPCVTHHLRVRGILKLWSEGVGKKTILESILP